LNVEGRGTLDTQVTQPPETMRSLEAGSTPADA
jgi:hypothetical protein